ncbi:MAG TPA: peptidoglycan -binding protein [Stellaceae bacterium]|nr:peptidoglycan -binding protein [Stellaceae bacterium]
MAFSSRRQRRSSIDIWPGFVDALSQLVMVIIFLLLVFTAGQFYLTNALSGRDEALRDLTAKLNVLTDQLALAERENKDIKLNLSELSSQLQAATAARDELTNRLARSDDATAQANRNAAAAQQDAAQRETKLSEAQSTIDQLNQQILALRQQLQQIAAALDASEAKSKDQQVQIADLGKRLNTALASKVEELSRYRSEFFGRLREVLGNRPDIRVVGDRFVFQSEVLFSLGSADLGDNAKKQLLPVAQALKDISAKIPSDLNWVLRVDGHTDKRPITTAQFPSNWELSTARAISVVRFFIDQGIPANRLVAAGFGENQPIDARDGEDAYRRNRRIELKLTER